MGYNDTPVDSSIHDSSAPGPAVWGAASTPAEGAISDAEALNALKVLEERRKQRRKQKIIKIAIGAAVVALVGAGVFFFTHNNTSEEEETGPIIETDVVVREDFSIPISGNGSLQAQSSTAVNPEVDGVVTEVFAQEGDQVEKGTKLYSIQSEDVEKDIEDAAEKVKDAESSVAEAQSAVSSAQSELNKANKAYQSAKAKADKAKKKYQDQKKKQNAAKEKAKQAGEKAGKKAGENAGKAAGDEAYQDKYDACIAKAKDPSNPTAAEKKDAEKEAKKAYDSAYDSAYKKAYDEAYKEAYAKVTIPKVSKYDSEAYSEAVSDAKAEVGAAQGEVSAAQGEVRAAQSELSAAQSDYTKAEQQREKCTISAPQAGTLVSFKLEVGDAVGSDSDASDSPVRISDLSQLRMSIEVNESDIAKVEVGQNATVVPQAFPDLTLNAKVSEIAESATGMDDGGYDGGSVTFSVKLTIDDPDDRLKPGMTASVKILTQEVKDALIVPTNALIEEDDGTYVDRVIDEETYETEHKKVKVQVQDSTRAVIKKGLKEGDVVVVSSIDFMDEDEEGDYEDDEEELEDDYGDDVDLDDAFEFEE